MRLEYPVQVFGAETRPLVGDGHGYASRIIFDHYPYR